jgi:hypothetical protein
MHTFTKLYLGGGLLLLLIVGIGEATGRLSPSFGAGGVVDTSSRQGSWYTYRQPKSYSAGPGRSPGSYGGSSGSGGYQGGK